MHSVAERRITRLVARLVTDGFGVALISAFGEPFLEPMCNLSGPRHTKYDCGGSISCYHLNRDWCFENCVSEGKASPPPIDTLTEAHVSVEMSWIRRDARLGADDRDLLTFEPSESLVLNLSKRTALSSGRGLEDEREDSPTVFRASSLKVSEWDDWFKKVRTLQEMSERCQLTSVELFWDP